MDRELIEFLKENIFITDYSNRDLTHFQMDIALRNDDEITKKLIDFLNK